MDKRLWKKRWLHAYLVTHILRFIPYVRMVGLNGSMVTGTMHTESDIDLYIVLERGRIFTGRLLVTLTVQSLGLRRHGKHVAGRVCLNRYATPDLLSIGPPNEYHARVFSNLIPLYAHPGIYEMYRDSNKWMQKFGYSLPFHKPVMAGGLGLQRVGEVLMSMLAPTTERWLRTWQQHRVATDPRVVEEGSRVVISDEELCFHLAKKV